MHIGEQDRAKIVEWAKTHPEISRIYLYGSRARGDHEPDSDIDLGIQMNATKDEDAYTVWFFWIEDFKASPDLCLEHAIDLQWYEPNAGLTRVGPGVERDGILLYSKGL